MTETILVTGATGLVGGGVLQRMLEANQRLTRVRARERRARAGSGTFTAGAHSAHGSLPLAVTCRCPAWESSQSLARASSTK